MGQKQNEVETFHNLGPQQWPAEAIPGKRKGPELTYMGHRALNTWTITSFYTGSTLIASRIWNRAAQTPSIAGCLHVSNNFIAVTANHLPDQLLILSLKLLWLEKLQNLFKAHLLSIQIRNKNEMYWLQCFDNGVRWFMQND